MTLLGLGTALCMSAAAGEPCRVEPFALVAPADREAMLNAGCGGEHVSWTLDTPRARPVDPGPSLVQTQVDTSVSEPLGRAALGTLKFSWAGQRDESVGSLRTERAALAAGGQVRLAEQWSLQADAGREMSGAARSRATVAGLWQPARSSLLYAEWAGSERATEAHRVGARWWLLPQRLAVDVGASHLPDAGWNEGRAGLLFSLPM